MNKAKWATYFVAGLFGGFLSVFGIGVNNWRFWVLIVMFGLYGALTQVARDNE